MKWHQFLNDQQLSASKQYHNPPNGEYLFGKIVHDVLECLTVYEGCLRIATKLNESGMPDCLDKWRPIVKEWAEQVTLLAEKHKGKYESKSSEWAKLISDIGNILSEAQTFKAETEKAKLSNKDKTSQMLKSAIRQSQKLELIWADIQNSEYKRLWTVIRYSDLLESKWSMRKVVDLNHTTVLTFV